MVRGSIRPGGRTERVRQNVANAVLQFIKDGETDFTMTDVAERSGIARSTIHARWPTGQIGVTADGKVPEQPEIQFAAAFTALANVLQKNGCNLSDVVDLTSFHVGYPANMDKFMQVMRQSMPGGERAWTAIGVAGLGYPGSLVELKAVAVLPKAD